jgi:hypothetical protein
MRYEAGRIVWIPCEVKPGPFSDERIVRILSERGDWVGFVNTGDLRDPVVEGQTFVRAVLVNVEGGRFNAKVAGEPVTSSLLEGTLSRVQPFAAVQA